MLRRFAKTWKIGDAIKIDLQRGMDLPAGRGVTCPGTNDIDIGSLTAGPARNRRLADVRHRPRTYTPVLPFRENWTCQRGLYKRLSVETRVFRGS